jgi:hypothetical protein
MAIVCAIIPPIEAADNVGRRPTEVIDHSDCVPRHVGQRITSRRWRAHDHAEQAGFAEVRQVGRETDVAVVHPHHLKAARRQVAAKVVMPEHHLHPGTHDRSSGLPVLGPNTS